MLDLVNVNWITCFLGYNGNPITSRQVNRELGGHLWYFYGFHVSIFYSLVSQWTCFLHKFLVSIDMGQNFWLGRHPSTLFRVRTPVSTNYAANQIWIWDLTAFKMATGILPNFKISLQEPGVRFNLKRVFPGMDFHCKDKTIVSPSYLYNGNSYTGKTAPYWDADGPVSI